MSLVRWMSRKKAIKRVTLFFDLPKSPTPRSFRFTLAFLVASFAPRDPQKSESTTREERSTIGTNNGRTVVKAYIICI